MSWTLIIIFLLAGLLFMLLEILVVPGVTVFGILGFVAIGVSVWQAYASHGTPEGHYFLLGAILFTILLLVLALKSKTWNKVMLSTEVNSRVNTIELDKVMAGDEGTTVSRLAPVGKAIINGEFYEVDSLGEYIEPQTKIVVISVDHSKIIVKPKT
ncbi:MAG: NfeD family protein [Bacteroidales bacterium]|nr:NfeD family protein [Bacteroidales bacterium]